MRPIERPGTAGDVARRVGSLATRFLVFRLLFMQWTRQISRLADRVGLFQLILSHIILLNHPKLSENLPAEHSRVGCGRRWDRSLCMRINACTKETLFQQLYDRNHEMIKLPLIPFYVR